MQSYLVSIFGVIVVCGLLCLVAIRHFFAVNLFYLRKMYHIGLGMCFLLSTYVFTSTAYLLFIGLLLLFIRLGLLLFPKLNLLDDGLTRNNFGTFYFPLAFIFLAGLLPIEYTFIRAVSLLSLTIGDPIASLANRVRFISSSPTWFNVGDKLKSVEGTIAMGCICFLFPFIVPFDVTTTIFDLNLFVILALIIATLACFTEGICKQGEDNFLIPYTIASLMLWIFQPSPTVPTQLIFAAYFIGMILFTLIRNLVENTSLFFSLFLIELSTVIYETLFITSLIGVILSFLLLTREKLPLSDYLIRLIKNHNSNIVLMLYAPFWFSQLTNGISFTVFVSTLVIYFLIHHSECLKKQE